MNDRTHRRRDRRARDAFVDAALSAAGVPIVRVQAAASYDLGELLAVRNLSGLPPARPACAPSLHSTSAYSSTSSVARACLSGG